MDGKVRFVHKTILSYFAARVLYEEIKFYQEPTDPEKPSTGTIYDDAHINVKLLKGSGLVD